MQRRVERLQHHAHPALPDDFRDLIRTEPPNRTGLVGGFEKIERPRAGSGLIRRRLDELVPLQTVDRLGHPRETRLKRLVPQMSDGGIPRLGPGHERFERLLTRGTAIDMPLHRSLFRLGHRPVHE